MKDDPKQTAGYREYHKLDNGNLRFVFVVERETLLQMSMRIGTLLARLMRCVNAEGVDVPEIHQTDHKPSWCSDCQTVLRDSLGNAYLHMDNCPKTKKARQQTEHQCFHCEGREGKHTALCANSTSEGLKDDQ